MFFHTHVYYSKKVDRNLDSLKVIGSFLPDLALTGAITWDDLHKKKNILDFFHYVETNVPEYNSLLKGIQYHNTLDYYTHVTYKNSVPGFAYSSIPDLMPSLVEKALKVTPERAKTSSHNVIESGVEYYILRDNPDVSIIVKEAIEQINKEKLALLLADFYKKDQKIMIKALNKLFSFARDYNLKTLDGWVTFWTELSDLLLKTKTDPQLTKEALELSLRITKDTYKEFIDYSILSQDIEIKDAN